MQTYFTWDFSREVAVGGEFETTGVLASDIYNVNVPRLLNRKTDVSSKLVMFHSLLNFGFDSCINTESQRQVLVFTVTVGKH